MPASEKHMINPGERVLDKEHQKSILHSVLQGTDAFNKHSDHKVHTLEQLTHGNKELQHHIHALNQELKKEGLHVVGFTKQNEKLLLTDDKKKDDPEHRMYQMNKDGTIDTVLKWDAAKNKFEPVEAPHQKTATAAHRDDPHLKRGPDNQVTDINFGNKNSSAHIEYDQKKQDHQGHHLVKEITIQQPDGEQVKLHNTGKGYYETEAKDGHHPVKYWAGVDQTNGSIHYAKLEHQSDLGEVPLHRTTLKADGSSVTHAVKSDMSDGPITHVDSADNKSSWYISYRQDGSLWKVDTVIDGKLHHYVQNSDQTYFEGSTDYYATDHKKYAVRVDLSNGDLHIAEMKNADSNKPVLESQKVLKTAATPDK